MPIKNGAKDSFEFERGPNYPTAAMTSMPPEVLAALSAMLGLPGAKSPAVNANAAMDARLAQAAQRYAGNSPLPPATLNFSDAARNAGTTFVKPTPGMAIRPYAHGGEVKESSDYGTLVGLREMLKRAQGQHPNENRNMKEEFGAESSTGAAKGYAEGGDISPYPTASEGLEGLPGYDVNVSDSTLAGAFPSAPRSMVDPNNIPPAVPPMAQPPVPPLSGMMQNLNQIPNTNYDFYKNIGSDERAALAKQILERQRSPMNLVAAGLGGIGDAIANSYGKQNTTYMKDIMGNQQKRGEAQLGAFDTQRQQRMQDMQANIEMQMSDPNSRIAKSMQQTLRSAGLNVPSGMPPKIMLQVAGPLGELAFKQAQVAEAHFGHEAGLAEAGAKIKSEATQELAKQGFGHKILAQLTPGGRASEAALEHQAGLTQSTPQTGTPLVGQEFGGSKIKAVRQVR